jgi:hypothetical protein
MPATPSCPSCGAAMAADQRYCVDCGRRRVDPPRPESRSAAGAGGAAPPPPPAPLPPAQRPAGPNLWSPSAALIAGVATLILAVGVGFLIGRAGDTGNAGGGKVEVIQVGPGPGTGEAVTPGGGEEPAEPSTKSAAPEAEGKAKPAPKSTREKTKIEEGSKEAEELQKEASEKVTHATVPQAKPTAKVGETCEEGTAGCGANHKFEGEFFPE